MGKRHPGRRARESWEESFRMMHERDDDRPYSDSGAGSPAIATGLVTFDQVVELVSQLPPLEQLRLIAHIAADLGNVLVCADATESPPGSAAAILRAMREPPHLSADDVDELEQAMASRTK
jgi:hypothetical protein